MKRGDVMARREPFYTICDFSIRSVRDESLAIIGNMEGWVEITVTPKRDRRSLQQLRFYFAVIAEYLFRYLRDDCGWELQHKGQAHDWAKSEFLKMPIINKTTGEVVGERIGSTGELDVVGMADFMDRVRKFLDENGVYTPEPDKNWRERETPRRAKVGAS